MTQQPSTKAQELINLVRGEAWRNGLAGEGSGKAEVEAVIALETYIAELESRSSEQEVRKAS